MSNDEETDEPLIADRRNFYKVEKWSRDGQRVTELLKREDSKMNMLSGTNSLEHGICREYELTTFSRPSQSHHSSPTKLFRVVLVVVNTLF